MIYTMQKMYPKEMLELPKRYGGNGNVVDIALGEDRIEKQEAPETVFIRWKEECANFSKVVKKYLLY